MIPLVNMTAALARAMGARPGWPNNPPCLGIYIWTYDARAFFWPLDGFLAEEILASPIVRVASKRRV